MYYNPETGEEKKKKAKKLFRQIFRLRNKSSIGIERDQRRRDE